MALLHNNVTVLDFDHTYDSQRFLQNDKYQWIKMDDIPSTSRYCANDSLVSIHERLHHRTNKGITFIGNGNYHYVSLLLLTEIQTPFSLILFDHHTDLMESSFLPLISCGSWVLHALERLPLLQKVIIVGVNADYLNQIPSHHHHKITVISNNHHLFDNNPALLASIENEITTKDIYISIDKDVLSETYAKTNWDHGTLSLPSLSQLLYLLIQRNRVVGIDICGELPFFSTKDWKDAQRNERANEILLKTIHLTTTRERKLALSKSGRIVKKAVYKI